MTDFTQLFFGQALRSYDRRVVKKISVKVEYLDRSSRLSATKLEGVRPRYQASGSQPPKTSKVQAASKRCRGRKRDRPCGRTRLCLRGKRGPAPRPEVGRIKTGSRDYR